MKKIIMMAIVVSTLATSTLAQKFDARNGFIFDQSFVTRVSTAVASKMTGVANIDREFFGAMEKRGKLRDNPMPKGVKRAGAVLFLRERASQPCV